MTAQVCNLRHFFGELVPTEAEIARAEGRTYETAEELLGRVQADGTARSSNVTRATRMRQGARSR